MTENSAGKKQRQRITVDLNKLFPGEAVTIGDQQVLIKPLVAEQIAILLQRGEEYGAVLNEKGVNWDNYNQPESVFKIASTLITQFPEILEELSDVHQDDLKALPIELLVKIVDKVIAVNLKAKDDLTKNFKSLTALTQANKDNEPEAQESETQE